MEASRGSDARVVATARDGRNFPMAPSSPTRPAPCGAALPASRSSSRCATASRCRSGCRPARAAGQSHRRRSAERRGARGAAGAVGAAAGGARAAARAVARARRAHERLGRRRVPREASLWEGVPPCSGTAAASSGGARAGRGGWGRCARHPRRTPSSVALPRQLQRARRVPPRALRVRAGLLWRGVRGGGATAGVPRPDVLGEGVVRQRQVRLQGGVRRPVVRDVRRRPLPLRASDVVHALVRAARRLPRRRLRVSARDVRRRVRLEVRLRLRRDAVEARRLRGRQAALRPRVERQVLRGAAAVQVPVRARRLRRGAVQVRRRLERRVLRGEALPGQLLRPRAVRRRLLRVRCGDAPRRAHPAEREELHGGAHLAWGDLRRVRRALDGGAGRHQVRRCHVRERVHHRPDRPRRRLRRRRVPVPDRPGQVRDRWRDRWREEEQGPGDPRAPRGRGPGAPLPQPPPGGRPRSRRAGEPAPSLLRRGVVRRWLHPPVLPHVRGRRCRVRRSRRLPRRRHVRVRGGVGRPRLLRDAVRSERDLVQFDEEMSRPRQAPDRQRQVRDGVQAWVVRQGLLPPRVPSWRLFDL